MPRVLIVSHFFPPHGGGGVHRALAWARHLPAFGWDVSVLAAGRRGFWVTDESLLARVPAATDVLRVDAPTGVALWRAVAGSGAATGDVRTDAPVKALARFFLLPDSYRAWAGPAVRAGRARLARGDVNAVLSTSPPETAHLVGEALARQAGLPWIADFRDPWVALHYRTPPTPFHAARHRAMERRVLERADRVLCASATHAEAVGVQLGDAGRARVTWLPNGIELEPASEPAATALPANLVRRPGVARAVATGTLVEVPALARVLDALRARAASDPGLAQRFELILAGAYDAALLLHAGDAGGAGPARFVGPLPHATARALQRSADALLLVRNEGPGYAAMVPGKLYEYLDVARPLVAAIGESEAAQLARDAGARVVVPTDGEAALDALLAAATGAPGAATPDAGGIARALAGRSRHALAGRLAAILDALPRRA